MRRPILSMMVCASLLGGCAGRQRATSHASDAPTPSAAQLVEIADVLARSGDRVRAGQYLTLAEKQGAASSEVLPRMLALYAEDGQFRLAIEHAENYLRRHPDDRRVRLCLASFYEAVGANAEAIREFDRVVAHEPGNADAHFALASLLQESTGERARSDAHYRAYLQLEPRGAHAGEARAKLLTEVP